MSRNKKKIELDIAVLTAGRADLFSRCVNHILAQYKDEYRIHVYNNGSPSAEYEEIYKRLPEGSSIKRSNKNEGFPIGANGAINSGSAPLCLFITDDIFIHDKAIQTLIDTMSDQSIGITGYKLLFPEDSTDPTRPAGRVQHVGMASNVRGDMTHPMMGWSSDNPKCNISRDVSSVTGASFIVRRDVFRRAGGFNPVYGSGYFEDTDLCFTIRSMGYRVYVTTQATATHGVGQTFATNGVRPNFQQNSMIFKAKWVNRMEWTDWQMW